MTDLEFINALSRYYEPDHDLVYFNVEERQRLRRLANDPLSNATSGYVAYGKDYFDILYAKAKHQIMMNIAAKLAS